MRERECGKKKGRPAKDKGSFNGLVTRVFRFVAACRRSICLWPRARARPGI